mgnify:CR=1 FL=1
MRRITIIGSGFAALTALRTLRKKDPSSAITIISPKAEFLYAPSLIWVPTGLRTGEDLVISLSSFFKRMNVTHHMGAVTGIKNNGRTVVTDNGEVQNDALIIASGGRFLKKVEGIENVLTLCEGVKPAQDIKERLSKMEGGAIAFGFAGNPQEQQALRGGPMFELLFGIDTWLRKQGKRDNFTLKFFCPAPKPGIRLGERAFEGIMQEMARRNIEVACLGAKIKKFEPAKIITETTEISADMILFMPGLTGPAWLEQTNLPLSAGGMIKADKYTRVEGLQHVYVIGDSASYEAPDWAPKQAHMADLQAVAAAENALAELNGQQAYKTFRWELICIIDTLDKGFLVFRNEKRKFVLSSRLFHWAKRFFEWNYVRQYAK